MVVFATNIIAVAIATTGHADLTAARPEPATNATITIHDRSTRCTLWTAPDNPQAYHDVEIRHALNRLYVYLTLLTHLAHQRRTHN